MPSTFSAFSNEPHFKGEQNATVACVSINKSHRCMNDCITSEVTGPVSAESVQLSVGLIFCRNKWDDTAILI